MATDYITHVVYVRALVHDRIIVLYIERKYLIIKLYIYITYYICAACVLSRTRPFMSENVYDRPVGCSRIIKSLDHVAFSSRELVTVSQRHVD